MDIPVTPKDITAEWLTLTLRQAGALGEESVVSVDASPLSQAGFVGELVRLRIRWDRETEAPKTLIAKLSSRNPSVQQVARILRLAEKEVRFYKTVAPTIPLRTPRCYSGHYDPATGGGMLLLEDLGMESAASFKEGCSIEQASTAAREVAGLHAAWWDDPGLKDMEWLWSPLHSPNAFMPVLYQQRWTVFAERFRSILDHEISLVGECLGRGLGGVLERLAQPPYTIVHGDYHLNNLFFTEAGGSVAVVDWQLIAHGCGASDVAFFVGGSLSAGDRKAQEMSILRGYHNALAAGGVEGYHWGRCVEDYRISMLHAMMRLVIAFGGETLLTEAEIGAWEAILPRYFAAILELDSVALLPD